MAFGLNEYIVQQVHPEHSGGEACQRIHTWLEFVGHQCPTAVDRNRGCCVFLRDGDDCFPEFLLDAGVLACLNLLTGVFLSSLMLTDVMKTKSYHLTREIYFRRRVKRVEP